MRERDPWDPRVHPAADQQLVSALEPGTRARKSPVSPAVSPEDLLHQGIQALPWESRVYPAAEQQLLYAHGGAGGSDVAAHVADVVAANESLVALLDAETAPQREKMSVYHRALHR